MLRHVSKTKRNNRVGIRSCLTIIFTNNNYNKSKIKLMKKLLVVVIIAVLSIGSVNAQNSKQNLSFEGVAGLNVSNWGSLGSKAGFHVGARAELALPALLDGIYTNTSLLFTLKGCTQDYGDLGKATTSAYYLELPIHIGYKYSITETVAVFGELGPYIGYGLFGNSKVKSDLDYDWDDYDYEYDYDIDYDFEDFEETSKTFDMSKRFDFGLGLRVGVELKKKYSVSLGYDWGLIDAYKRDEFDGFIDLTPSMKHKNLTISLGYKF